jgi:hypothetical protein
MPLTTGVFEVSNPFAFLAIDFDDGQALALKTGPQRANVLKYPVRAGMGGDLLAIDAQREIHLV